jgi:hypothetical protein
VLGRDAVALDNGRAEISGLTKSRMVPALIHNFLRGASI